MLASIDLLLVTQETLVSTKPPRTQIYSIFIFGCSVLKPVYVQGWSLSSQSKMSTFPCPSEVRQQPRHQPAAARSGPRPTRRINAHILIWVRKRKRGLSLWDLARPTRHIPSHNAALSTTAQQPWQGAEKKCRRRTDVLLTLMRPPKTLWILWVSKACICTIFADVFAVNEGFLLRAFECFVTEVKVIYVSAINLNRNPASFQFLILWIVWFHPLSWWKYQECIEHKSRSTTKPARSSHVNTVSWVRVA